MRDTFVLSNRIGKNYVVLSTFISTSIVFLILILLMINSWQVISLSDANLFSSEWAPYKNSFGILPMLYGTVIVTFISLFLAIPLGIATSIFTAEILPEKYRYIVKSVLELLAGIPSIIYGLIGIAFFSIWIQDFFQLQTGRTILTAGILLSIMILPTIITLSDDALRSVPKKYREASKGLGLYQYETIRFNLLPIAKSNIIGAVLLALGRALGETMAVMLVIGSIDEIASPFYNWLTPGQTVTSKLGREIAETSFGSVHFSALIFMGFILLSIVLVFTIIAQHYSKRTERLYE
ncbi:MAG: phosphate ABC transporter permease subunit PstC [Balneola sp.]